MKKIRRVLNVILKEQTCPSVSKVTSATVRMTTALGGVNSVTSLASQISL